MVMGFYLHFVNEIAGINLRDQAHVMSLFQLFIYLLDCAKESISFVEDIARALPLQHPIICSSSLADFTLSLS
jgi:hypothetical protein